MKKSLKCSSPAMVIGTRNGKNKSLNQKIKRIKIKI